MKSRRTKRVVNTKKTKKTKKAKSPLKTNARYVYWYACAYPRFGLQVLKDVTAALQRQGFELSPDQLEALARYLDDKNKYEVSARQLLEGICFMKQRQPKKEPPTVVAGTGEVVPLFEASAGGNVPHSTNLPQPPPPPWGNG